VEALSGNRTIYQRRIIHIGEVGFQGATHQGKLAKKEFLNVEGAFFEKPGGTENLKADSHLKDLTSQKGKRILTKLLAAKT